MCHVTQGTMPRNVRSASLSLRYYAVDGVDATEACCACGRRRHAPLPRRVPLACHTAPDANGTANASEAVAVGVLLDLRVHGLERPLCDEVHALEARLGVRLALTLYYVFDTTHAVEAANAVVGAEDVVLMSGLDSGRRMCPPPRPTLCQGVVRIIESQRRGTSSPQTPKPPRPERPSREKTKFTVGKMWKDDGGGPVRCGVGGLCVARARYCSPRPTAPVHGPAAEAPSDVGTVPHAPPIKTSAGCDHSTPPHTGLGTVPLASPSVQGGGTT